MFWHNVQMDRVGVGGDEAYRTRLFLFNVLPPNLDYSSHILKQATQNDWTNTFATHRLLFAPSSLVHALVFSTHHQIREPGVRGDYFRRSSSRGTWLTGVIIFGTISTGEWSDVATKTKLAGTCLALLCDFGWAWFLWCGRHRRMESGALRHIPTVVYDL